MVTILRLLVLLAVVLGSPRICPAEAAGDVPERDGDETAITPIRQSIAASKDDQEKALLYKKIGDLYVSREDFKNAAEEYIQALSLKNSFSARERLQMAVAISWGDRLNEAIAEFRSLLRQDPQDSEARIHLARTLSWSGEFDESLDVIEPVLIKDPGNKDALLIKANDLRLKGEAGKALPLYRSILEKQEDFDTRLGYTYALLDQGDEAAVRESMALLKPAYPYQENELTKLNAAFNRPRPAKQLQADVKYTHYRDTDRNEVDRYMASFGFPAGSLKNVVSYVHTEAHDDSRRNSADAVAGETWAQVTRRLSAGAGLGIIRYTGDRTSDFLFGHLNADADMAWGSAGLSLSSEPLTDTAELIEKNIRVAAARAYLSHGLTSRSFLFGSYRNAYYSDDNKSHDLLISPRYVLLGENPRLNIGYRFRYLDFDHQSFSGYFDPNRFLSHQLFLNISFASGKYFGFTELFVGQQSFTRYNVGHYDMIYGGTANIGYKLTQNVSVEMNGEAGNYALQSTAGFQSYQYGIRLSGVW
jgi:thioredoxin-like negative regulator of GroEL